MNDDYAKNMLLITDAVLLANKLTWEAKQAEGTDRFESIMRVADKAWKRYYRRAKLMNIPVLFFWQMGAE